MNKRTELFLEEAEKRLKSAKLLLDEGFLKDSISRSYYAMLSAARAFLLENGRYPKTHKGVMYEIWLFVKEGKFDRDKAIDLRRALEMRETSDYEPVSEFSYDEASALLNDAAKFVSYVRSLLESHESP